MTLTVAQFRSDFPEFTDTSLYPDALVNVWMTVASTFTANTDRWGTLQQIGGELCTAHYLVLAARNQATAQSGSTPGTVNGLMTAKSVGDVSASYDTTSVSLTDAGFWNQTSYGIQFLQISRLIGSGGMQLPGFCCW